MPTGNTSNKIYFKYYSGTTAQTRNAVKNTAAEFLRRAGKK